MWYSRKSGRWDTDFLVKIINKFARISTFVPTQKSHWNLKSPSINWFVNDYKVGETMTSEAIVKYINEIRQNSRKPISMKFNYVDVFTFRSWNHNYKIICIANFKEMHALEY